MFSVASVPAFSLPSRCVVTSHFCLVGCFSCSMWDRVPWPRMNLGPMCWEHGILATGPPGKSPHCHFKLHFTDYMWCGKSFHILICHLHMFFGNVGDGQGGLVCCGSWDRKESDTTERLNWTELSLLGFLAHLLIRPLLSSLLSLKSSLCIPTVLYQVHLLQIFSPTCGLYSHPLDTVFHKAEVFKF